MESHEKNGPVLLQNVAWTALGTQASGWFIRATRKERRCFAAEKAPTPLGTHEHSRVRLIRAPRCPGLGSPSSASPFRDVQIKAGLCHVKVFS